MVDDLVYSFGRWCLPKVHLDGGSGGVNHSGLLNYFLSYTLQSPVRLRESSNFCYSTYLKLKLQATKVTSNYTLP